MAKFTRATTPDITLTIENFDARAMDVYVTISQGSSKSLTLTGDRLIVTATESQGAYTTSIAFKLTQSETLKFGKGNADVQARFIDAEQNALATEVQQIMIDPVLYEKVIRYE